MPVRHNCNFGICFGKISDYKKAKLHFMAKEITSLLSSQCEIDPDLIEEYNNLIQEFHKDRIKKRKDD